MKFLYFSRSTGIMDRLWFHQCIQGLFSLVAIRTRDVREFVEQHPYQSNIRLIEAQQDALDHPGVNQIKSAYHLPDRSVLFQPLTERYSPAMIPLSSPERRAELVLVEGTPTNPSEPKTEHPVLQHPRSLPVYVREEQDVEIEDEETELGWKNLEERLQEEVPGEEPIDEPVMSTGDEEPPAPAVQDRDRISIFDRFDTHIDASRFGAVAKREEHADFVSWLTGLNRKNAEPVVPDDEKRRDKESGKSKKKKNKAKKEAKRLAKRSVQKKRAVATETLAELLTRQGHHQDAIDMYERLCLIYPEKKSIFAARIEMIKSSHP